MTGFGALSQEFLAMINGAQVTVNFVNGDVVVDGKQIITGNKVENGIINVGDNNTNQNIKAQSEVDRLFVSLIEEINDKLTGQEKRDALNDVKAMEEAVKSGNMDRGKRFFGMLSEVVRTSAAAVSIATHCGWLG